ncbi:MULTISPECIES: hypothetical protein [Vibrio]|uniref:Response regulator n=1 Tax=Vibrio rumoiensis 1S-45 TaxID=1188252 RepID=A0A1E5E2F4_9VIBR|nr:MULTISPECIES: hypothetical protein [Vibrio]MBD1573698.1 hypothetical protein [Vibrio sp. S17_S38]OEF25669.1 hypothetical protein A1QC_08550 [Vibrio rumoiensis 1S-45]
MLEKKKEKELVRNFLKENELVKFSVRELTDLFCKAGYSFDSRERTYQYVYRGLCRLESEGWLISEGEKRTKRYSVVHKKDSEKKAVNNIVDVRCDDVSKWRDDLTKERSQAQAELSILLGEIDEYVFLMQKYQSLFEQIQPLLVFAREGSAKLLGKINALSNVLSKSNNGSKLC